MYNEKVKRQYLEEIKSHVDMEEITKIIAVFQKSSILEERYNKDLAYFDKEEMIELLSMFNHSAIVPLRNTQKKINDYFKFYSEKYDKNVHKIKIPMDTIRDIVNNGEFNIFAISKQEFEKLIEKLIESHNAQYAFILVAVWSGLSGFSYSEVPLVKRSNINVDDKTLSVYTYDYKRNKIVFDRVISVSDLFIRVAELADKEMEYVDAKGRVLGKYEESEYVIKNRVTSLNEEEDSDVYSYIKRMHTIIYSRLQRLRKNKDYAMPNMSFEGIRRSGIAADTKEVARVFGVPLTKLELEGNQYILKLILEKYNIDMTYMKRVISTHIL